MPVFLIGYMCSGKTTLGKELSTNLQWPFIDLDNLIEQREGRSVANIFKMNGENYFRELEKKLLREYDFTSNMVIATGGGTPCFYNNIEYINHIGVTIYLKVSVKELLSRIESINSRPLLIDNMLNLNDFIKQQMQKREIYYSQSKHNIQSDNITIEDLLKILQ
ncbi:MAG: shikimate kinase [Flavobacteriales bacterium]|nr:shikimate kinase [Flavobacteriales bacterium]|tara:strand:- start:5015 stop:5506 length:492 start_codon:yes stop_codon:yes gene_type:complete